MPRRKKSSKKNAEAIALYMHRVLKKGSLIEKQEIVTSLIMEDQIEFLEQIKMVIGDAEYNRIVGPC